MSTLQPAATPESVSAEATTELPGGKSPRRKKGKAGDVSRAVTSRWASLVAIIIAVVWTTPTLGLFVTSFRGQRDINTSGWWTAWREPGAFTLENYRDALAPGSSASLGQYFINTIVITVPAVLLLSPKADARWETGSRTALYPGIRIVRAARVGQWDDAVDRAMAFVLGGFGKD